MKIDLRKLYTSKRINLNEEINIPEEYYQTLDIINISPVKVNGDIFINLEDEIELNLKLEGIFTLPCAITLEEFKYPFNSNLEEIINENIPKNQLELDLFAVLWENIVLEVPMKAVKEGTNTNNIKGEGWQVIKEGE